jgi:hypothetical protein
MLGRLCEFCLANRLAGFVLPHSLLLVSDSSALLPFLPELWVFHNSKMVAVGFTESTRFPREPDVPNKFQNAVRKTYLRTAFKKI